MKRRDFIKRSSAGIVVPSLLGTYGAQVMGRSPLTQALQMAVDTDRVLVLIYLDGGNDGLNTVVPLDQYDNLAKVRPHVLLPKSSLLKLPGTEFALHPSMGDFRELYEEGKMKIIQSVGYPNQNYSHFRSTDIWMSGSDSNEVVNSGWGGRYLAYEYPNFPLDYPNENTPHPLAVEIGFSNSLLFQGPTNSMSMVLRNPESFHELVDQKLEPVDDPNSLAGDRILFIRDAQRQSQVYGQIIREIALNAPQQLNYPDNSLADQLQIVARLIAGGLQTRLYMVKLGGFDTHEGQVEESDTRTGRHATLLRELSESVGAFVKDLKFLGLGDRVMGMTLSEFGRRIISNASHGTDHGAAAPLFIFGNCVAGGVLGNSPTISPSATYEDNLEMQYDFRSIYSSVFEQWLCVDPKDMTQVSLNNYASIPITRSDTNCLSTDIHDAHQQAGKSILSLYPNPVDKGVTLEFEGNERVSSIVLFDLQGRHVRNLLTRNLGPGTHRIIADVSDLVPGQYYVTLIRGEERQSRVLVKM